jgi:predicted CopG family antitoxin
MMTRQVALADATYDRLKRRKRAGESFSQVIERLLAGEPKDPLGFVQRLPPLPMDPDEWVRRIEADRDATRTAA